MACVRPLLQPYRTIVPMITGSHAVVAYLVRLAAASATGQISSQRIPPSRILTAAYSATTSRNNAIGSNVAAAPRWTAIPQTANSRAPSTAGMRPNSRSPIR